MSDKVFYNAEDIKVTDKKFIVGNKTYVLSNVTSIDIGTWSSKPIQFFGVILIIIALLFVFKGGHIVGGILWMIFGIILILIKSKYSVLLRTAGNENSVYSSKNKDEIIKIIIALNDSVSHKSNNIETKEYTNLSVADELKKLQDLKKDGVLTEEEFEVQKSKILNNQNT